MYNMYFSVGQVPAIGSGESLCTARVGLRNPAGVVIGWHCLLSQAQYNYHRTRNGKAFNKAPVGSSKTVTYMSKATGKQETKACPVHQFAGVYIDDQETRKLHIPDRVDDMSLDSIGTP
jgi:hypothetical protein